MTGVNCSHVQGEVLQIVGVEPPQPGCQPSMLELKTSTMQIVRLPLDYAGSFEEVVDRDRLYSLGTSVRWSSVLCCLFFLNTITICNEHVYLATTGPDINRTAELRFLWVVNVKQSATSFARLCVVAL